MKKIILIALVSSSLVGCISSTPLSEMNDINVCSNFGYREGAVEEYNKRLFNHTATIDPEQCEAQARNADEQRSTFFRFNGDTSGLG